MDLLLEFGKRKCLGRNLAFKGIAHIHKFSFKILKLLFISIEPFLEEDTMDRLKAPEFPAKVPETEYLAEVPRSHVLTHAKTIPSPQVRLIAINTENLTQ